MLRSKYQGLRFADGPVAKKKQTNPITLVVLGYLLLILVGAILLQLPISLRTPISFLEALFTATSAVCVTGLSVLDISSTFTHFGDWVLLVLMQLGGLGIMTVSTTLILLAGMHPGFNHQSVLLSAFSQEGNIDPSKILKAVLPFTFILELIGAAVYFTQFSGATLYDRIFVSVFQAVSSFCNVGFTLFPDSLVQFQLNPLVNLSTCVLALAGGFGFLAVTELQYVFDFKQRKVRKISLHTRIATFGTLFVVAASVLVFSLTEWNNTLGDLSVGQKFESTLFMAFTSRTAGLNTVDVPGLCASSLFFFIVIMFIGACAGSTGGGIKVSRVLILFKSIKKEFSSLVHPQEIRKIRLNDQPVAHAAIRSTNVFISIHLSMLIISSLVLSADGQNFTTNFTASLTTLNNMGPGLDLVGPAGNFAFFSIPSKLMLIFNMLAGRLELFPLLLLLYPGTYKKH